MSENLGAGVTRVLEPEGRQWSDVVHQQSKPLLDSELNLTQAVRRLVDTTFTRLNCKSGVFLGEESGSEIVRVYPTRGVHFDSTGVTFEINRANEIALDPFVAMVNGWIIPVATSQIGGEVPGNFVSVKLGNPPLTGERQDLVMLEVWRVLLDPLADSETKPEVDKIYYDGNRQFKYPAFNPSHEMVDPYGGIETTKRVQVQYRIRVVESVDVDSYPDGLGDSSIIGWGAVEDNDSGLPFIHMWSINEDFGLYRAGSGDSNSQTLLGTVDGYSYSIPLFVIHRRNRNAYNVGTNPNGSSGSILGSVDSDRPDCLLSDEIADRDVLAVYHAVAPQGFNFEELAEGSFDKLIRGTLGSMLGDDWTNAAKGTRLLTVDGISSEQFQGIYQIGYGDDHRDAFADAPIPSVQKDTFTEDEDKNTGILNYVAGCNRVQLIAPTSPAGSLIANVTPTMTWVDSGETVGLLDGWHGLGTALAYADLDTGDENFQVGGDIRIVYTVLYGAGGGLRYAPVALHKLEDRTNPADIEDFGFGFVDEDTPRNVCRCEEADESFSHWHDITPCDFDELPRREIRGSFAGNGTDTIYIGVDAPCEAWLGDWVRIPVCEPYSFPYNLVGFGEFELVSTGQTMPTLQIVRAGENFYEIKFCRAILASETIQYRAYTKAKIGAVDASARGLMYVGEPVRYESEVETTPDGGYYVYEFETDKAVAKDLFRMPFTEDAEVYPFMYIFGLAVPIADYTFQDDFTVQVKVLEANHPISTPPTGLTACPCISTTAELYLVQKVTPASTDHWAIFYDFIPYQGLDKKPLSYVDEARQEWRHQFIVKATGGILANSRGSGASVCTTELKFGSLHPVPSEVLPLPANADDSDLLTESIEFGGPSGGSPEHSFFGLYHGIQQASRLDNSCPTKDFRAGNLCIMLECEVSQDPSGECPCICDPPEELVLPEAKRGVPGRSLMALKDRFTLIPNSYFGWQLPTFSEGASAASYQGAWYTAVADRYTGEVYLLVVTTYFSEATGEDVIHSECTDPMMAFDLYHIPGRPLAAIYRPRPFLSPPPFSGAGSGFGSG
jgi:hypothetical protein